MNQSTNQEINNSISTESQNKNLCNIYTMNENELNECPVCFSNDKPFYITCGECKKISFCNKCFEKEKNSNRNLSCCLCRHSYNVNTPPPQNTINNITNNTTINLNPNTQSLLDIARQQRQERINQTAIEAFRKFIRFTESILNDFNTRFPEDKMKIDINLSIDAIAGRYDRRESVRYCLEKYLKLNMKIKNRNNRFVKVYLKRNYEFTLNPFMSDDFGIEVINVFRNLSQKIFDEIPREVN